MRLNSVAVNYRLRKLMRIPFGLMDGILDAAHSVKVLHPVHTEPSMPALYLEQHLQKIQRICSHRTRELEDAKIHGYKWPHAPTIEYKIRDIKIRCGHLYKGPYKMSLVVPKDPLFVDAKATDVIPIRAATMASTYSGNAYFGPFLREDLPLSLLAEDYAENIVVNRPLYHHEPGYREMLGCPRPAAPVYADVAELTLYQDFGKNPHKRERYLFLRNRLKQHLNLPAGDVNRRVYIKRGQTGVKRVMTNEAGVEAYLHRAGFVVIEPARLTPEEISRALFGARVVVSVEGSHISHSVYSMADNATLLVLQPPDRFSTAFKDFTDCLDMRFAFLVGDKTLEGFDINIADLERLLNRIEQTA